MRLIDADAILERLSCDTTFSMILRDMIEEQPVMICETIKDAKIYEIGVLDIQDCIKKDLAKEIACFMLEKGLITFNERHSSDGMLRMVTAIANVVTQMPKESDPDA